MPFGFIRLESLETLMPVVRFKLLSSAWCCMLSDGLSKNRCSWLLKSGFKPSYFSGMLW